MQQIKNGFRHESLQDAKSIQQLLKALQQGLKKGKLQFEDEDGEIELRPNGLLRLRVRASQEDSSSRLDIRISWEDSAAVASSKTLKVQS